MENKEEQKKEEQTIDVLGKCPWCGGDIIRFDGKNGTFYSHLDFDESECSFKLEEKEKIYGKEVKLTDANVRALLKGKAILVKGIPSRKKEGTTYDALYSISREKGSFNDHDAIKWEMSFPESKGSRSLGKCPWCGKDIFERYSKKTESHFYAHGKDVDCPFILWEEQEIMFSRENLDADDVHDLLSDGYRMPFTTREGEEYFANVVVDKKPRIYNGKKYPSFVKMKKKKSK
ncbi:MAG: topoisomerase DNA-binding C4 zinc finger domain-containing protein [Holdemanella sp.]|nr:topoisomerase DNA-binding C4 zinc finger domain-containing protein [Holdemanella sp.]